MTNKDSDPDFYFPPSSSLLTLHRHQSPLRKHSKSIKIEPSLVPSSSIVSESGGGAFKAKFHGKKPDPSAPKITRPCSECGKKFWSWKALFGHMRCHPERQWRGINPPPDHRRHIAIHEMGDDHDGREAKFKSKSRMTAEDHEVASCLILLANNNSTEVSRNENSGNCGFECSGCKKVFESHQALGGHRASHKNVKGCFAMNRSSDGFEVVVHEELRGSVDVKEEIEDGIDGNNNKMLMLLRHKCSICWRVFSSGQALGGHKRCHWEKMEEASSSMNEGFINVISGNESCGLDLNLPAPPGYNYDESASSSSSSSSYYYYYYYYYYSSAATLDLRLGL